MKSALVAAFAALLLVLPSAATAKPPSLTARDREQIGNLVDRFVKDAVRREDLRAAWSLAGPSLRGGTTKAAWIAGTGVTVESYPARGNDFTKAWTGTVIHAGDVDLSLMLRPTPGHPDLPQTAFNVEVVKTHGRWIVNDFYPAASFGAGGRVVGPNDFQAPSSSGAVGDANARIRPIWFDVAISIVGALIVLLPLSLWVRAKRRDRRAYEFYLGTDR